MFSTVPIGFVDRFKGDFILLSQQRESRLERLCRRDPDMLQGRFGYFDRIGQVQMQKRTSRHQDTSLIEAPHSRRRITLTDYELAQLLDKQDVMRLVADPQGKYMQNAIMAANRQKDDIIVAASDAVSYSIDEDNAATPVALPSSQIVPDGGTGFSLAKVLAAKEILDAAEVDEQIERFAVVTTKQITAMLNDPKVTSEDYNTVKALVDGKIEKYLGFTWIRSERLKKTATVRRCIFTAAGALGLAIGEDVSTSIDKRPDKGNATQLMVTMSADVTRIEDEKIVFVDAVES